MMDGRMEGRGGGREMEGVEGKGVDGREGRRKG